MKAFLSASPVLLILVLGCSGSVSPSGQPGDGGASDSGRGSDAGGDAISRGDAGGDAGGGSCRTAPPTLHRPSAATCSAHVSDAGADSGVGACMAPHDDCLVDSDCGSSGVCDCEEPRCTVPFAVAGNVCVPSDCHVDSDCPCGFCAGDVWCGNIQSYHCTTPHDECSTDTDCQDGGTLTQCRWSTDHWACVEGMGCPG
jgi:hypothetical protein